MDIAKYIKRRIEELSSKERKELSEEEVDKLFDDAKLIEIDVDEPKEGEKTEEEIDKLFDEATEIKIDFDEEPETKKNKSIDEYVADRKAEINKNDFLELIRDAEGLRLEPYKPDDTEKYFTIGYGHYGEDVEGMGKITKERAEELLDQDVTSRLESIKEYFPDFEKMPRNFQLAAFSEHFRGSIEDSPKTVQLIKEGKFEEAAEEYLRNQEYLDADSKGIGGIRPRMEKLSREIGKLKK